MISQSLSGHPPQTGCKPHLQIHNSSNKTKSLNHNWVLWFNRSSRDIMQLSSRYFLSKEKCPFNTSVIMLMCPFQILDITLSYNIIICTYTVVYVICLCIHSIYMYFIHILRMIYFWNPVVWRSICFLFKFLSISWILPSSTNPPMY